MKKTSLISIFVLCMIMVCSIIKSQTIINNDKQIISMLKKFYTEYITISSENVMSEKKLYFLEKKYCTVSLLKKLPAIGNETDADPFLKAQDAFKEDINTLSIVQSAKNPNKYIVSYGKKSKIIIEVSIVDKNGEYKIDGIK